jgi:hypothetical protein
VVDTLVQQVPVKRGTELLAVEFLSEPPRSFRTHRGDSSTKPCANMGSSQLPLSPPTISWPQACDLSAGLTVER